MTLWQKSMWGTLIALVLVGGAWSTSEAAAFLRRHYYSSWSYYPSRTYYYRSYFYKPYVQYEGYKYHYCIYYTSRPRYVYYYNPYVKTYWGRYDLEKKGYSELAAADRKASLSEIPETAFPAPGAMPAIPESEDGERIPVIEPDDLPKADVPKDAPQDSAAPRN